MCVLNQLYKTGKVLQLFKLSCTLYLISYTNTGLELNVHLAMVIHNYFASFIATHK